MAKIKKLLALGLCLCMTAGITVGCGDSKSSKNSTDSGKNTNDGLSFAFCTNTLNNTFQSSIDSKLKELCDKDGISYTCLDPDYDLNKQLSQLSDVANNGYDGIKIVAVTLGKEGVLICNRKDHQKVSGFSSQVVDTTGAGDSFWGGFMSQFVKSKLNPEDCSIEELKKFARYGNAVASLCIEKKGGILSIPEEKETFKRLQLSV